MSKTLILVGCFLPLAIIYIIMKLSVWIVAVNAEQEHVREESRKPHTYMANVYADVDEEDEEYGSKTDYR